MWAMTGRVDGADIAVFLATARTRLRRPDNSRRWSRAILTAAPQARKRGSRHGRRRQKRQVDTLQTRGLDFERGPPTACCAHFSGNPAAFSASRVESGEGNAVLIEEADRSVSLPRSKTSAGPAKR